MRTIQEKYNAILEGKFSKSQFVKDAKRELSQFLSPYNGYEDTVSILKSKGVIYEAKKQEVPEYDLPGKKYSDEALRRGVDYELEGMGLMSQESISEKDFLKAEKKAIKNLDKDPNYYLHLLSGDSKKVDKHDQMVPVKKNNHVDTFNGLKKAELKEAKELLKEGKIEDLAKKLNVSVEALKAAMEKIKKGEMTAANAAAKKAKFSEAASDYKYRRTHDGDKIYQGEDGEEMVDEAELKEYDQADAVADYIKDFYRNPDTGESIIDDEIINDFYRTHPEWEEQADGSDEGMQAVLDNFNEFLSVNTDYIDEKKGKDHDGDGDIDGDDYMAAKDKAIKKAMGKNVDENQGHDYVSFAMQNIGGENTPVTLTHGFNRYDEKKYKTTLGKALAFIKKNADVSAIENGDVMVDGGPGVARITIGDQEFDIKATGKEVNERVGGLQEFISLIQDRAVDSEFPEEEEAIEVIEAIADHYGIKIQVGGFVGEVNEGRRRKMKGGKVVTENDYETGGYVESMGPMLEKAMRQLEAVWEEWKAGPATEAAMVPHAKKDLVSYLESRITVGEDIVEDTVEEHQELKEAFKAIISKVLAEEVINEAATGNLSKIASTYNDFEGFQAAINDLENIVTDVESYYAKTKDKIQKVYDSFKDIKNTEGLAVGAMLGPAIEAAFRKDLMPVTEKGFTKGLEMPKVKMLETDEIAEEELEEKETVFKPVTEGKKYKYTKRQK